MDPLELLRRSRQALPDLLWVWAKKIDRDTNGERGIGRTVLYNRSKEEEKGRRV